MKTKFVYSSILLVVSLGLFLGFKISDGINGSKTTNHSVALPYTPNVDLTDNVSVYTDDFDGDNTNTGLQARGYKCFNVSTPVGSTNWSQGATTVFNAFNGPATGYVSANYNNTGTIGTIDNWMILPRVTGGGIQVGDSLTFWSRSTDVATTNYPDSMRVMYSANGDSTVAGTWVELGRYRVPNAAPGAPDGGWVKKGFRAPTAGVNGRFAVRYGQVSSGLNGTNSDYIGIDAMRIERTSAPPPVLSWYEQTTPVAGQLASVSAASDNAVWAVGYTSNTSGPPLVVRTTNGGTWTNALGTGIGATVPLFNVWGIDENTALITGSNATGAFVYRTSNGGSTWTTVFTQPGGFMNAIVMSDANNGFMTGDPNPAAGGRWSLFKTTNGGVNWDSTGRYLPQTGSEAGWNNGAAIVGTNIWFATNNTKVYYSSNNGANWTGQATGEAGASGAVVWFNNATNGFYGGATLKMTTNGGGAWTANAGSGTGSFGGITGLGTNWWTIRGTTAVGTSTNDGSTWSTAYTSPSGNYIHIAKSRTPGSSLLWVTKSNGQVSKYGVTTGVTPVNNEIAKNYSLSQNYPNPFNPSTTIKFAIPASGLVSLKIYNMLGKEVATLVSSNLSVGTYTYDFNASNLASGVYFYKLETANFSEVKKMSLIK